MIVSFALLAIFLVAASAFIGTITNLFYNIKGETYSRQVSDILLQKLESEIDGSKYEKNSDNNLKILAGFDSDTEADVGNVIDLYDKTDTHVKIYSVKAGEPDSQKDEIKIYYYPIIYLPVRKGEVLGRAEVFSGNKKIRAVNITADEDI